MLSRLALGALFVVGCAPSPRTIAGETPVDPKPLIAAGRALWAQQKATCPAYHYDREVNFGGIVTVQIVGDAPQFRWYLSASLAMRPPDSPPTPVEWVEEGTNLGSHPGYPAAETVEQLWDECAALLPPPATPLAPIIYDDLGAPTKCMVTPVPCPASTGGLADCVGGIDLDGFSCGTIVAPQLPVDAGAD